MKPRKWKMSQLHSDVLVLCASLVLSEPTVNRRQVRLAGKIIRAIGRGDVLKRKRP